MGADIPHGDMAPESSEEVTSPAHSATTSYTVSFLANLISHSRAQEP